MRVPPLSMMRGAVVSDTLRRGPVMFVCEITSECFEQSRGMQSRPIDQDDDMWLMPGK